MNSGKPTSLTQRRAQLKNRPLNGGTASRRQDQVHWKRRRANNDHRRLQIVEQLWLSSGTMTVMQGSALPGMPDGVTVNRSRVSIE
jgi:hypothetical protein